MRKAFTRKTNLTPVFCKERGMRSPERRQTLRQSSSYSSLLLYVLCQVTDQPPLLARWAPKKKMESKINQSIYCRQDDDAKGSGARDNDDGGIGLVSVGNLEAAVTLLLSTPPEGSYFYVNALRAVALSSAVSMSLHELAVKVVAANMVRTEKSLYGTHLLCAVGRYQEACSQDAGYWTDAATLAATHLQGSDYARALMLYVASGAMYEALSALRASQLPDAPAMFLLACHEINSKLDSPSGNSGVHSKANGGNERKPKLLLPIISQDHEDVAAVGRPWPLRPFLGSASGHKFNGLKDVGKGEARREVTHGFEGVAGQELLSMADAIVIDRVRMVEGNQARTMEPMLEELNNSKLHEGMS
ncbi:WD repeat-containing protein 11 [Nymphaea thermarum]|nr:WD repeat-containing protein 11 [Nymphaea thermarum]